MRRSIFCVERGEVLVGQGGEVDNAVEESGEIVDSHRSSGGVERIGCPTRPVHAGPEEPSQAGRIVVEAETLHRSRLRVMDPRGCATKPATCPIRRGSRKEWMAE